MDKRPFLVFDFETSSIDPSTTQILQIGACMIDGIKLKIIDEFQSIVQPDDFSTVEQGALEVNHLTTKQLENAPSMKAVWPAFANWIKKYHTGNSVLFSAPIACGWNIANFDLPIFNRYCKEYKFWSKRYNSQTLVNPTIMFDVMQHMWMLTRFNSEVTKINLGYVLGYMGVDEKEIIDGAHDAMWDTKMTAEVGIKILKLCRNLSRIDPTSGRARLKIKDCMKKEKKKVEG